MLEFENEAKLKGHSLVIGIDEAGRGPLAGPVVAAAVFLKDYHFQTTIRDSKKVSPRNREEAFFEIYERAYVGVGIINESVIDDKNILNATFHAMTIAVEQLIDRIMQDGRSIVRNDVCLLVDGPMFRTDLPYPIRPIVNGDQLSLSIACASIVAKVTRDRILTLYDKVFPQYGFKQHKGYPTKQHKEAIKEFGPSIIHRKSFNCV